MQSHVCRYLLTAKLLLHIHGNIQFNPLYNGFRHRFMALLLNTGKHPLIIFQQPRNSSGISRIFLEKLNLDFPKPLFRICLQLPFKFLIHSAYGGIKRSRITLFRGKCQKIILHLLQQFRIFPGSKQAGKTALHNVWQFKRHEMSMPYLGSSINPGTYRKLSILPQQFTFLLPSSQKLYLSKITGKCTMIIFFHPVRHLQKRLKRIL